MTQRQRRKLLTRGSAVRWTDRSLRATGPGARGNRAVCHSGQSSTWCQGFV
jgi:hypothetical protein